VQALDPAARRPIGRWLVPSPVQKAAFASQLDDWEHALIELALARVLDADDAEATELKEARDDEAR
jgi:hypothetical protein